MLKSFLITWMKDKTLTDHMKDPLFVLKLLGVVVTVFLGWLALYGDSMWFSRESGEALERRQVTIESDSKHRDDLIMKEQHHLHEKLDDMRLEQKEDISDLKGVIIDYIRSKHD